MTDFYEKLGLIIYGTICDIDKLLFCRNRGQYDRVETKQGQLHESSLPPTGMRMPALSP